MSIIQPSQAAALLGREIDAGFAAAYADLSSSRAVVVDRIVARVGALPPGFGEDEDSAPDWSAVPWRAEVTLEPQSPGDPMAQGEAPGPDDPGGEGGGRVRREIGELSTKKIRGVGPVWATTFASWGLSTVAELAEEDPSRIVRRAGAQAAVALPLLSRARDLAEPWPRVPASALGSTIAEIARQTPAADDLAMHALRARCLRVLGALDAHVAAVLQL